MHVAACAAAEPSATCLGGPNPATRLAARPADKCETADQTYQCCAGEEQCRKGTDAAFSICCEAGERVGEHGVAGAASVLATTPAAIHPFS